MQFAGGSRQTWLRVLWVAVALLCLGLFLYSLPLAVERLSVPCSGECEGVPLAPADARELTQAGLSPRWYALYVATLASALALGFVSVSALLIWRKAGEPSAMLAAFALLFCGTHSFSFTARFLSQDPFWNWPVTTLQTAGNASLALFFATMPNGRFSPSWSRFVAFGAVAWSVLEPMLSGWPWSPAGGILTIMALVGIVVHRFRRVLGEAERLQVRWVVVGIAAMALGFVLLDAVLPQFIPYKTEGYVWAKLAAITLIHLVTLLFPAAIVTSIFYARLWDIDLLISRAFVYTVLTALVAGLYVGIVTYLVALLRDSGDLGVSLLATGLIAVIFQPLRDHLQRLANRLVYGQRDDPYAVLTRLARRLEITQTPDSVLATIAQTVRETLKLPYAAVSIRQEEEFAIAAAAGDPASALHRLPIIYQGEAVGELVLGRRAPGEPFGPTDQRLLEDLARLTGPAAHAVRLTVELQRSRERLVTAREEERRRLRRDLHDGLGPALAAQSLKIGTARYLLKTRPEAANRLLAELESEAEGTIAEIKRLVYNLRPPVLDEVGLVAAIRADASRYGMGSRTDGAAGLYIAVEEPTALPALPAAVEVAALRITQEAVANVVRHARARSCHIRIACNAGLELEIRDDGIGFPARHHHGVGLGSMRERAEELGGTCIVEAIPGGGTRVWACLPLTRGEAVTATTIA